MTETLKTIARDFIGYYTKDHRTGVCSNCGGLPHTKTCFVGRFEAALTAPQPDGKVDLAALRAAYDDRLITEVNEHGGIPHLHPKELALREAIAALLIATDDAATVQPRCACGVLVGVAHFCSALDHCWRSGGVVKSLT